MFMVVLMQQMVLLLVLRPIVSFLLMRMLMVVLTALLLLPMMMWVFLISCADLSMFVAAIFFLLVVGLSSIDLSREYFGRRFNQKPIAIFDIPEPCDIGKALIEFFKEMRTLSMQGLYIHDPER